MATKITFVTGKGGVGKSTVAAALAVSSMSVKATEEASPLASEHRSLLAEIGDHSFYQSLFAQDLKKPVVYEPQNLMPGLDICLWTGEECLKEYTRHLLKLESLHQIFFENPVMKTFMNIAPGLRELSIMGKATSGPRKHGPQMPYGKIFMDSYATGHFMALLRAPTALAQTITFGAMGEQSRQISATLRNPAICEYVIVTIPEEQPIQEAIELYDELKKEIGFSPRFILNRCLVQQPDMDHLSRLKGELAEWGPYLQFLRGHWERQEQSLHLLKSHLEQANESGAEITTLPFILNEQSMAMIQKLSRHLSNQQVTP